MTLPFAIARFYKILNPKVKCEENEFVNLTTLIGEHFRIFFD